MVLKKTQLTLLDKNIDPKISSMIEPAGIAQYCIDRATIDKNLEKYNLINYYWEKIKRQFNYEDENPTNKAICSYGPLTKLTNFNMC